MINRKDSNVFTNFMICLIAILAIAFIGGRSQGFSYQVLLGASGCLVFAFVFLITYMIAG